MENRPLPENIRAGFKKAGLATAQRHLFVCIGPDCCAPAKGEALWERIKNRVRETGLEVMRTKAACFRICSGGPWLLVYPEGVWYGEVTEERFEVIFREHLEGNTPVERWISKRHPLPPRPESGINAV